jgi:hypothetical protein
LDHYDVLRNVPRPVESRFELAAVRIADAWLAAGRVKASADDLQIARDFLEQVGCNVRELPGVLVQLEDEQGRVEEMSREAAILEAFRRLVARGRHLRPASPEDESD